MADLEALRKLSHALRTLRNFDWYYDDDCKCALAVAQEIGIMGPIPDTYFNPFGLSEEETDYIFFNGTPHLSVTPTVVAQWIDEVIANHAEHESFVSYAYAEGALEEV